MTKDEALKLALKALKNHCGNYKLDDAGCERWNKAVDAIKEALAPTSTQCEVQPEQEPFGYWHWEQPMTKPLQGWFVRGRSDGKLNGVAGIALYAAPFLPVQEPWMYRIWNDKDAQWQLTDDCSWPAEPIYTTPPLPEQERVAPTCERCADEIVENNAGLCANCLPAICTEQEPVKVQTANGCLS